MTYVHWSLDDIAYDRIDKSKVTPGLLEVVKAAALVEFGGNDYADHLCRVFADDALFRLWAWHAIEESEHRAVAFDVYKAIGGDEETRARAMRLSGLALVFISSWHTLAGVVRDRRSWRNFGLPKSLWRNRTNPLLSKRFRKSLAEYYRADFHPLDRDTSELEDAWRSWLDGGGPGRCKPREPR